jgi:hypothetical protein
MRSEARVASVVGVLGAVLLVACEGELGGVPASGLSVDRNIVVTGIADAARDPSVVYLDAGEGAGCAATLVAPAVLLTARRCVAHTSSDPICPASGSGSASASGNVGELRPASSLAVHLGEAGPLAPVVARGAAIVTTGGDSLCDHDLAFVVLDAPLAGIAPLTVSTVGAAKGHAVRTVGYGGSPPARTVRDHLTVLETASHELEIGEASCDELPGGPSLDDANGAVVGVRSRSAVSCLADSAAGSDVFTRVDVFTALFASALDQARALDGDAGVSTKADAGHKALEADVGGACQTAADCASGICVTDDPARYCSRTCAGTDRCPTGFTCRAASDGVEYCAAS